MADGENQGSKGSTTTTSPPPTFSRRYAAVRQLATLDHSLIGAGSDSAASLGGVVVDAALGRVRLDEMRPAGLVSL